MHKLVKYWISFNCFSSLSFWVQAVHIVRKECVDRGKLISEKLKRDIIEPSSAEVQGAHRENSVLSSERDRVTENSVGLCQEGIEWVKVCTHRTICWVQGEDIRGRYSQSCWTLYRKLSTRCALRRRFSGGHKVFLWKETKGSRPLGDWVNQKS